MDYEKKSKKGRKKANKEIIESEQSENIETITKDKLKNYFELEVTDLTKENLQKFSIYIEKYEDLIESKLSKNLSDLHDSCLFNLKKLETLQIEDYHIAKQHEQLDQENTKIKEKSNELMKKFSEKEKITKLLIDKIKTINEEKHNIIQVETERRSQIVQETEKFVKEIQEKYEQEIPDKQKAIDENQKLRKEIENCVQSTMATKEDIENKIKQREMEGLQIEENYKKDIRMKMEETTSKAQKYLFENSELKSQIISLLSKNEEMEKAETTFKAEFVKLENELDKKKQDIILITKENFDLQKKVKKTFKREALEQILKEAEKLRNQLNLMKNLNKKLNEQHQKLLEDTKQVTLNE